MPISSGHAFRRGMISSKALTRMKGSASMGLKGKVVGFNSSKKTDEHKGSPGAVPKNEINARRFQKTARVAGQTLGKPMQAGKGNYVDKPGQPKANAIDQGNSRKWSAVSKVKKSNAKMRMFGGSDANGSAGKAHYYGGPSNNKH